MKILKKEGFNRDNIVSYGNMFLIGNGHLGYRGTLEEYKKEQMVGLNVAGFYDRYEDKWRESVNIPNPFYVEINNHNILKNKYISHYQKLDISNALFHRRTEYDDLVIESSRFVCFEPNNHIVFRYKIYLKKDKMISLKIGTDTDIYEINGPHFRSKNIDRVDNCLIFTGLTNEKKIIVEKNNYKFDRKSHVSNYKNGIFNIKIDGKNGQIYVFKCFSKIIEKSEDFINDVKYNYNALLNTHKKIMSDKWSMAKVTIEGNKKAQDAIDYSIYHLLILGNEKYSHSIPARGVSGQTYKGAIFWDTEIFMLPFYTLTFPNIAKKLIEYRLNTYNGAVAKAKDVGYGGAFYAWESQDDGIEACSKYNVTDPITNEPIRTYFDERQIHISADIAYGMLQYIDVTNDYSFLTSTNMLNVLEDIVEFYRSYSTIIEGKYHFLKVIGPDEYHDLIDDNAYTNIMVKYVTLKVYEIMKMTKGHYEYADYINFANNIYIKDPVDNVIEQFDGYNKLEDSSVEKIKSQLRHPNEYYGFIARNTKIIKQADVITLLVLLQNMFDKDVMKANFDYYYKNTEHGSSLSSSMYSIIASKIGYDDIAYDMFYKSASIDLGVNQKMYAGGIYIGGTHPASNAGAYLSLVFGMCGLTFKDGKPTIDPHLPKHIDNIIFKIIYRGKKYLIDARKGISKI